MGSDRETLIAELRERLAVRIRGSDIPDPLVPPPKKDLDELPFALRYLPKDPYGYPDWARAMDKGFLLPRDYITDPEEVGEERRYDRDVVMEVEDEILGDVVFSHRKHNLWLACDNCHPFPFREKRGETRFSMMDNWKGRYCGLCHGKVAFMLRGFDNCLRCHTLRDQR